MLAEEEGRSRQATQQWRDLGNKNANDLFLRKPQLAAAQANLESAQGNVDMAELNLSRTKIVAPFDGRIKQTYANLGQFVSTGSRIATVYDSTVVEVRLPLTENQAALINLPLTASNKDELVKEDLPPVIITGSVAGETYQWSGELARTDAFVDANSRMYYAVVEVADPFAMAPLLPGLFVAAEISGKQLDNVVVLPRKALYQRDQILSLDEENKIVSQSVRVLRKSETQVWVQMQLQNDTLIALEKQSLITSGTLVDPVLQEQSSPENSVATAISTNSSEKE